MKKSELIQLIENITKKVLNEKSHTNLSLNTSNIDDYTFEQLKELVKLSDTNNPDEEECHTVEKILVDIGFYEWEGNKPEPGYAIVANTFNNKGKTKDGKTLNDLLKWFEKTQM